MSLAASVVVPTYNGARRIGACLEALAGQKTDREHEVIVVDDGSCDGTAEVVGRFNSVHLIRQKNAGPGAARNNGVRHAKGNIVVFTDDDCVPEPDWLERMLAPFENAGIAGIKGAYLTRQHELTGRFVQIEYEEKYARLARRRFIDFVDTYSAAFRRQVFLEAGGYDPSFPTASVEDQELSFRLASAGHKMVFVPEAKVWHAHVDSPWSYLRKKHKIGYWKVLLLAKNPGKIKGDSHTPTTLKLQVLLTMAFPASFAALALDVRGFLAPAGVAGAFFLTALPLTLRCLLRDFLVGVFAPVFVALRALGLTTGLLRGSLAKIFGARAFRSIDELPRDRRYGV